MSGKNKKVLITGAGAQLGVYFRRAADTRGFDLTALTRQELDITDKDRLAQTLRQLKPDIIVNCASYNLIDKAELDPEPAMAVNARAVEQLAALCREYGIFLVHYSSAHVFDGVKHVPYTENDAVKPVNVYGQSKLAGEKAIQEILQDYLILRLSWAYGTGKNCFLTKVLTWSRTAAQLKISKDEISIPAYSEDIVAATLYALRKSVSGLYHLTSVGQCSRAEYVRTFIDEMGIDREVVPVPAADFKLPARRPLYSCMAIDKIKKTSGLEMPPWQEGLKRFTRHLKAHGF